MSKSNLVFFVVIWLILPSVLKAHNLCDTTYVFTYDDSGNRTGRTINFLKSTQIQGTTSGTEADVITEELNEKEILIYPNPTKGDLKIEIPELGDTSARLFIFNNQGKLLIDKRITNTLSEINISQYSSGLYILKILIEQNSIEWKIIKD